MDKKDVQIFVLRPQNSFLVENKFDFSESLSGLSLGGWIKSATDDNIRFLDFHSSDNILLRIKPYLSTKKYVLILYIDTPLIVTDLVNQIIDYFRDKKIDAAKFNRGYIFESEFIKNNGNIENIEEIKIDTDLFTVVKDELSLSFVSQKISERIINKHLNNGVKIICRNTVKIDARVRINKNAKIYPNNILSGDSFIKEDVVLYPMNYIKNSAIMAGATVSGSTIENSIIKESSKVGPFSYIRDRSVIGQNTVIQRSEVSSSEIGDGNSIYFSYIEESKVLRDVMVYSGSKIKKSSIVESNCIIGENSYISSTKINENSSVEVGSIIVNGQKK